LASVLSQLILTTPSPGAARHPLPEGEGSYFFFYGLQPSPTGRGWRAAPGEGVVRISWDRTLANLPKPPNRVRPALTGADSTISCSRGRAPGVDPMLPKLLAGKRITDVNSFDPDLAHDLLSRTRVNASLERGGLMQ
jgi:hypothetical protein